MKRTRILWIFLLVFFLASPAYAKDAEEYPTDSGKEVIQMEEVPQGETEPPQENSLHSTKSEDELQADKLGIPAEVTSEDVSVNGAERTEAKDETIPQKSEEEDSPVEATLPPEDDQQTEKVSNGDSITEEVEKSPEKDRQTEKEAKEYLDGAKSQQDEAADSKEKVEEGGIDLEKGATLELAKLAEEPIGRQGASNQEDYTVTEVYSFDELKQAILAAGNRKTKIIVKQSFFIKETVTIQEGQDIILTADNQEDAMPEWEAIEQPSDYAGAGEEKQREIIERARQRGEEAIQTSDKDARYSPESKYAKTILPIDLEDKKYIKRDEQFTESFFIVKGSLQVGDEESSIYFDGNRQTVESKVENGGTFLTVENKGKLTLKNGTLTNGKNTQGNAAPVSVRRGGTFTMEGGRIFDNFSQNTKADYYAGAGGVHVSPGAYFLMKNGIIDHNRGNAGGVFLGDLYADMYVKDLYQDPTEAARFDMEGGIIVNNIGSNYNSFGGGIGMFSASTFNLKDGIIAKNRSGNGGGIFTRDGFIYDYSNTIDDEWARLDNAGNYTDH